MVIAIILSTILLCLGATAIICLVFPRTYNPEAFKNLSPSRYDIRFPYAFPTRGDPNGEEIIKKIKILEERDNVIKAEVTNKAVEVYCKLCQHYPCIQGCGLKTIFIDSLKKHLYDV
jgi:hypothetical protein